MVNCIYSDGTVIQAETGDACPVHPLYYPEGYDWPIENPDEEHLHIVAPELCRAHGYAPTPENIETLSRAVFDLMQGTNVKVQVIE